MPSPSFRLQLTPEIAKRISGCDINLQDILFALFQDSVWARARQVVISTSTTDDVTWLSVADNDK